jgi:hypothetical protein
MSQVTLNKQGQLEASIGDAVRRVCATFNKDTITGMQFRLFRSTWPVSFVFDQLPDFLEGRITAEPTEGKTAYEQVAACVVDVRPAYDHEERLTDIVLVMEFTGPQAELLKAVLSLPDAEVHLALPNVYNVQPSEFSPYFTIEEV